MTDTPQWNDEPMDARLRDLAKEYNRPSGVVPRDEMWQAIAPAVRAARAPDIAPQIAPQIAPKRRHIAPYAWGAALAAGLVLGIMLEREVLAPPSGSGATASNPVTDMQRVAVAPSHGIRDSNTAVPSQPDGTSSASGSAGRVPAANSREASSGVRTAAGQSATARATNDPTVPDSRDDAQRLYRVAARQTLVQAEALLTAYRATDDQHRDKESMLQAGKWARDVLTSTRLLLDSPAANDPQFRALFTDLELVLAQIVQLSGAPLQAGERELIERAMRDRDLLPRLRSALPAGATDE